MLAVHARCVGYKKKYTPAFARVPKYSLPFYAQCVFTYMEVFLRVVKLIFHHSFKSIGGMYELNINIFDACDDISFRAFNHFDFTLR